MQIIKVMYQLLVIVHHLFKVLQSLVRQITGTEASNISTDKYVEQ